MNTITKLFIFSLIVFGAGAHAMQCPLMNPETRDAALHIEKVLDSMIKRAHYAYFTHSDLTGTYGAVDYRIKPKLNPDHTMAFIVQTSDDTVNSFFETWIP